MLTQIRRLLFATFLLTAVITISAADKKPDRAQAARLNNFGVALMNQQFMEKAVAKFDEAIAVDPTLATAPLNKGMALLNLQKLPEAEQALKQAAALDPSNPRVWYNLGLLHRSQGKNDEGIADFRKAIELDPHDADAHYLLGAFFLQMQQYDKAVPEYEAALKLNHLHASAEFGLARALQRLGKLDVAREHLKKFEYLTRNKIAAPMTLTYGEQGPLAMPQDVLTGEPPVSAMIPVTFSAQPLQSSASSSSSAAESSLGSGVCVLDVNGDSQNDLIVLQSGDAALQVFLNQGKGQFKSAPPAQFGLSLKGTGISCAVGDFDNDGRPDLAIATSDRVALFRNVSNGQFSDVTKAAGIEPLNQPSGMTFVDYDHDGDLDLFVAGRAVAGADRTTNIVWRNNGNGTFTNWSVQTQMGGDKPTRAAMLSDINNDRAVDLVVTGDTASPLIYANQREGKFNASPVYDAALPPTVGLAILDFNKDGWMDIALTHAGAPGVTFWKNIDGKRFERVPLPDTGITRGWGITSLDVDNDGWVDFAAVAETAQGSEVRVYRNLGTGAFADVSKSLSLDKVSLRDARSLIATDIDRDGATDLITTQANGSPIVLHNDGATRNHSLRIALEGLADSKSAFGTKVEVFANGLWQKFELPGASGYLGQGSNEILVGLGSHTSADIVRMLWPTGVIQDETEVALDKPVSFTELDRRGSSCPTLFVWNGKRYEFVSDVIGAAVVGHWISPTEKNIADPDEWTKIDGSRVEPKNGYLSVRFGEPMEEVNFLDQFRMIAVDHPASVDVYPDERFVSNPPFPSGRPVVTSKPHLPSGAWDDHGNDVLDLLRSIDHKYVRDFTNLKFAGYSNMHALTLDLGEWSPSNPLRMYLHGFIEYFTATSMYAAWQAKLDPIAPFVEAQMPDGSWKRVIDDMGFPAGLPRMIVVDLTGKLPAGVRKIRIKTNLQIYWDQILVDNGPDIPNQVRQTELPLASATLAFRGYPRQIDNADTPGDLTYDYQQVSRTGPFSRQRGSYTRYGDVTGLLKSVDDQFAIFGSGEDIDAEFDAAVLPALPQGWKRDYFFYANGWVKDMDFYEALPFTVADMPFQRMSRYPYPATEHYPDDASHVGYRLDWNDRFDSGNTTAPSYDFHYEPRKE